MVKQVNVGTMKALDGYEFVTAYEERLLEDVKEMESNSEWIHDVKTNQIRLIPIDLPVYAEEYADKYGLDYNAVFDTAQEDGTRQIVHDGKEERYWCLSDTGLPAVGERAKLFGSALGRMKPAAFAETMNYGFEVAKDGDTLAYLCYGRVASLHAERSYEIMPISDLLEIARRHLQEDFGYARFVSGTNRHDMTSCIWELPEMQEPLINAYKEAIKEAGIHSGFEPSELMPGIKFQTSNTSNSSAFLFPMFRAKNGSWVRFTDGIGVRHEKRPNKSGIEAFDEEANGVYAKLFETPERIKELASVIIYNGPNCVVSLCKKYGIPKKYGDEAREMIASFTDGGQIPTNAHDIYFAIAQGVGQARFRNASSSLVMQLEESVARMLRCDFTEHDVAGTVSWGNK